MKQLKFLMIALTVLMSVTFTSCLNSDDSPAVGYAIGRCVSFYPPTFFDVVSGKTIKLAGSGKTFEEGKIYSFYYTLVEGQTGTDETTPPTVQLYNNNEPTEHSAKISEGPVEVLNMIGEANAPMYMLSGSVNTGYGYSELKPFVYDFGGYIYLMVTPAFWYKTETTNEALVKELEKHNFVLSYDINEMKEGDTELMLTLNHVIMETSSEEVKRDKWSYLVPKAYNLSYVINTFQAKTGNKPTKIKVTALTNSSENSLEDAEEEIWSTELEQN